jgi:hypothetical protein
MFSVDFDDETGIIECRCEGYLTVADVLAYDKEMRAVVDRARRSCGSARLLVHANSHVQTAEVMDAVTREGWTPGPGDRSAFIVTSTLAKLQAARLFDPAHTRPFVTEGEARDWLFEGLLAHVGGQPRAVAVAVAQGKAL